METQPQPRKTDPEDMSRPGPLTFLILLVLAAIYVGVAYGDQVMAYFGQR